MKPHVCAHCGKGLSRKAARLIDGVVMCSTCMFKPASRRDTDGSPKGGDGEAGSVRSTTAGAEGIAQKGSANTPEDA